MFGEWRKHTGKALDPNALRRAQDELTACIKGKPLRVIRETRIKPPDWTDEEYMQWFDTLAKAYFSIPEVREAWGLGPI